MNPPPRPPLLIAGLPRSGTTWTMQALSQGPEIRRIPEPDNEDYQPSAIHAKHRLGRYPVLGPGDRSPDYRRLWEWIFSGVPDRARYRQARRLLGPGGRDRIFEGRPDAVTWLAGTLARDPRPSAITATSRKGRRLLVKSIHAQLALEWLDAEFAVDVLVLLRHPANILASWREVNLKDARNSTLESRPEIRERYLEPWGVALPGPDPVERMSWRIGLLTAALDQAVAHHPDWKVRRHEELCADPVREFRQLSTDLGLEWTEATETYLRDHDSPGEGFAAQRVASGLSSSWRQRLEGDQVATLRRVLAQFPVTSWSDADFAPPAGGGD